jgi:hypothetical protein
MVSTTTANALAQYTIDLGYIKLPREIGKGSVDSSLAKTGVARVFPLIIFWGKTLLHAAAVEWV